MKPKNVYFSYIASDEQGDPEFDADIILTMKNKGYEHKVTTMYRETYRVTMQFTRKQPS